MAAGGGGEGGGEGSRAKFGGGEGGGDGLKMYQHIDTIQLSQVYLAVSMEPS